MLQNKSVLKLGYSVVETFLFFPESPSPLFRTQHRSRLDTMLNDLIKPAGSEPVSKKPKLNNNQKLVKVK